MNRVLGLSVLLLSLSVFARKGPMPHERIDTPNLKNANSGRYIYLGDAPKFEGKELEITISKMNLTTRVTAHISQEKIDSYANQMFLRWKTIDDALMDPAFSLHPLVKISKLAEGKPAAVQAWAKIAEQYSSHILETTGLDIYLEKRNARNYVSNEQEDIYKSTISEAYFKYIFATHWKPEEVVNDNSKLEKLLSAENSRRIFFKHLGHLYTEGSEKSGYIGALNFVYPIAATTAGPFSQPKEMVIDLKTAESIEARWWSNKWKDEFGGFPFLLIEWSGVAFTDPLQTMDLWMYGICVAVMFPMAVTGWMQVMSWSSELSCPMISKKHQVRLKWLSWITSMWWI